MLNTEIAIPPRYWQKKFSRISEDLPEEYGQAASLNKELQRLLRLAEDIIQFALDKKYPDPVQFVKQTFHPAFLIDSLENVTIELHKKAEKVNLEFFFQFKEYIKSKETKVTPGMMKVFNNVCGVLLDFETYRATEIKFEEIDYNFYEELVEYLLYHHVHKRKKEEVKGLKLSSAGKIIKQLRIFLRNRMRKKIISPINLEDFKILDEEADAVYVTSREIMQIFRADLSTHPHLRKYQMLFVFGCLTGLRFSDFSTIEPNDVRNKMLYKKQGKSDGWVVIPLKDEAYYIFVNEFNKRIPNITNPDFNWYIKEVAKYAGLTQPIKFSHKKGTKDVVTVKPKYQWITSHTCRRSFCTNEFLAGTPVELIMKISGHKSLRDFYRYIKITPEEAGQKIRELWERRGDMNMANKKYTDGSHVSANGIPMPE
ncbi:site-specific integrase [Flavisolibacter ginsenosidimutans]